MTSIRIITKDGAVVAYQGIAGAGGKGLSAYIPATTPDAWAAAQQWSVDLNAIHTATRPQRERDPLRGLRLSLHRTKREESPPVVYVEAQWRQDGRPVHRSYSADRNGLLDAVVMAMAALERGTGRKIDRTARQVLAVLAVRSQIAEAPIRQRMPMKAVRSVFELATSQH